MLNIKLLQIHFINFSCVQYIYEFAKYHHIMLGQEPKHVLNIGGPNSFFGYLFSIMSMVALCWINCDLFSMLWRPLLILLRIPAVSLFKGFVKVSTPSQHVLTDLPMNMSSGF